MAAAPEVGLSFRPSASRGPSTDPSINHEKGFTMTTTRSGSFAASTALVFSLGVAVMGAGAVRAADVIPSVAQQASGADAIVGDWKPTDMDVDIRIFPKDGKYVGGVVKAANPALVNSELLREIQFDPAAGMWRGEIFALKRGEFVPMTIKMTATGFEMVAGSGFMSKTVEWVRVQ
jgi:hypothetical protein